ncbi:hypothetical protein SIO70_00745 [Chitinophaga sancti]|uniref:hypothetical protein n=1 Tax=Chitinophaga sancti TaxID=1004 RepID=UPI002A759DB7|nr:hypothetical protein [Chitinophaga sancti]WPQ63389.1 hypothetical protein SIO70_00745 [Chitinophaga sancti]
MGKFKFLFNKDGTNMKFLYLKFLFAFSAVVGLVSFTEKRGSGVIYCAKWNNPGICTKTIPNFVPVNPGPYFGYCNTVKANGCTLVLVVKDP